MNEFESIEIRRVENGFIVVINTEDDVKEYVYDTSRKAVKIIKQLLESKNVT
jgi:tRNA A37 threonylcarbamoyladenosine synthetase subunit TsaC/SUA5/YrdC